MKTGFRKHLNPKKIFLSSPAVELFHLFGPTPWAFRTGVRFSVLVRFLGLFSGWFGSAAGLLAACGGVAGDAFGAVVFGAVGVVVA